MKKRDAAYQERLRWNRFAPRWVISLPYYGAFLFAGTEQEAEEMRAHKANCEGEVARKRLASPEEIASGQPILRAGDCGFKKEANRD